MDWEPDRPGWELQSVEKQNVILGGEEGLGPGTADNVHPLERSPTGGMFTWASL